MKNGQELERLEQLRTFLQNQGPADALRSLGVIARELAEANPEHAEEWNHVAAAAEPPGTDEATEDAGEEDDDDEDEDDDEDDDEDEEDEATEDEEPDVTTRPASPSRPPRPRSQEKAMKKRENPIVPARSETTHWRARRQLEDGTSSPELYWGCNGFEVSQWELRECTYEEVRRRWGPGRYSIWWYGPNGNGPNGKIQWAALGRVVVRVLDANVSTPPPPSVQAAPAIPAIPSPAPSAPDGTSDLLAALAAMRPNPGGGGTDMAALLPILSFISDQQNKQALLAEARFNAERAIMMERERLASKERIAQYEANAHAQVRGARGFDPASFATSFAEQIRDTLQETIESALEARGGAVPSGPSEMVQLATMIRDTIMPGITMLGQKLMIDTNGLPGPYKPVGA